MNELRRLAYLEAMGIDTYVSRRQLPGAAVTQRLAVVARRPVARASVPAPLGDMRDRLAKTARASNGIAGGAAKRPAAEPRDTAPGGAHLPRFSLSAIVAGSWLWLEELGDMALTVEQVHLVEAMARALRHAGATVDEGPAAMAKPEVTQFDWPIHTNRQLELGEQAARAAVAGFVNRRLEQFNCAGLVLLGGRCAERVPVEEIGAQIVCIQGSLDILANPSLKPQVWRDLMPLVKAS
jgi:hypothetical protein